MKVKTKSETRKLKKQLVFDKVSLSIIDSKQVITAKEKINNILFKVRET